MGTKADVIGLVHHVENAFSTGIVELSPRSSLLQKSSTQLNSALDDDALTPAQAGRGESGVVGDFSVRP